MAWYVDGYSPAEIAAELDADPAAVRQNLAKARKNLKQVLVWPGARDDRPGAGRARPGQRRRT